MRTKRQKQQHQGELSQRDIYLLGRMNQNKGAWFTSLTICNLAMCVSARDKIRKLQASGIKIGPAKLLRVNPNGTRIYGWRIAK